MEINIEIEELKKRKLSVCVPMYGGVCAGMFSKSLCDLALLSGAYGLNISFHFLYNESLVTRARNYLVDEFLRSGNDHMIFIDSDISFDARDVLTMLAMQSDDSPYDILCGPYPKKVISWEKVTAAVNQGKADVNPNELENYVGDFVFNPVQANKTYSLGEPFEVLEGGTGFMMIRRSAFGKFKEAYPELSYKPDHIRTKHFDGSREIHAFFDTVIDPETKRYLSEDYMFSQYARKAGLKVWLCPWMRISHFGSYLFNGSLPHLAGINASMTADPNVKRV